MPLDVCLNQGCSSSYRSVAFSLDLVALIPVSTSILTRSSMYRFRASRSCFVTSCLDEPTCRNDSVRISLPRCPSNRDPPSPMSALLRRPSFRRYSVCRPDKCDASPFTKPGPLLLPGPRLGLVAFAASLYISYTPRALVLILTLTYPAVTPQTYSGKSDAPIDRSATRLGAVGEKPYASLRRPS